MHARTLGGIGLAGVGVFLPLAFALEAVTRPQGTDGDNAAESLVYLEQHGQAYAASGACLVLAAVCLIRAATALPWQTPFLTAVGSVAAGLWAFTGALRISSPGPIGHIRGYDEQWAEAAYLVVQMAGTQGGLLSGVVLVELWILTGCVLAWRSGTLPRSLCLVGMTALVYPLVGAVAASGLVHGEADGALWLLGVASLVVGLPVWFLSSGVWVLVSSRQELAPWAGRVR